MTAVDVKAKSFVSAGTSPATTPVKKPETRSETDLEKPWTVIVYDDPVNLMNFVALVFRKVFGYSEEKATMLMLEVHEKGKSLVWTGAREKAEFYAQQLQGHQLLAAVKPCG